VAFDARAYLEDLERPTYTDTRGQVHIGALVSIEEWRPVQQRMGALLEGAPETGAEGLDYETLRSLIREMTDLMFPAPWWKRLLPWCRTVTDDVLSLPPIGMLRATWDFIKAGVAATGVELEMPDSMRPLLDPDVEDAL